MRMKKAVKLILPVILLTFMGAGGYVRGDDMETMATTGTQTYRARLPPAWSLKLPTSTRLKTVLGGDAVLDKGRIVETGIHHELLANGRLYKKLFEMQFNTQEKTKPEIFGTEIEKAEVAVAQEQIIYFNKVVNLHLLEKEKISNRQGASDTLGIPPGLRGVCCKIHLPEDIIVFSKTKVLLIN